MSITGRIIEERKTYYLVDSPDGPVRATIRGVLKKDKKRVCVGDMVDCQVTNTDTREGQILKILPRSRFLKRPPLVNIDQVLLVCTFIEPPFDFEAIDRFLVCAGAYELYQIIVFNKCDTMAPPGHPPFQTIINTFRAIGYPVLLTSAVTGEGIDGLTALCKGHVSAFAGLSGVGKSALLSKIFPDRDFKVGELSDMNGRGTHTTTHVSLVPLSGGGYIADTPGLSYVDLPLVPEEDVATYFPELDRQIGNCKFNNCIHDNEPGCRVRELVEAGEIAPWRVEHYLKIYQEMKSRRREYRGKEF